jgi:hypothetical protein
MADAALENAERRFRDVEKEMAELARRMDALKGEREHIRKFIDSWYEFADLGGNTGLRKGPEVAPMGELVDSAQATERGEPLRARRTTGNPKKEDVVEAARTIIAVNGEPMGRSDLFKALREQGIILQGADPEMVLSTMLWRMRNRVVRLPGGGYWLADKPSPDGKYTPGQSNDVSTVDEMPAHEFEHAVGGALGEEE